MSATQHITVKKDGAAAMCLGYAGDRRAIALPCPLIEDEGMQWAVSPFHGDALINRATMECLDTVGGDIVLAECSSAASQRWAVPAEPASGPLHSLADPTAAGSCAVLLTLADGPCWGNATLAFAGGGAAPAGAELGLLPAAFGGDITVSAEVNAKRTGQTWARVFDFGTTLVPDGRLTGDNVILACSERCVYQVYHGTQVDPATGGAPPSITSRDPIPDGEWFRVAVVHRAGTASMYFANATSWQLQATGAVDPPAFAERTRNHVGVSNWPRDPPFEGQIRSTFAYARALP